MASIVLQIAPVSPDLENLHHLSSCSSRVSKYLHIEVEEDDDTKAISLWRVVNKGASYKFLSFYSGSETPLHRLCLLLFTNPSAWQALLYLFFKCIKEWLTHGTIL